MVFLAPAASAAQVTIDPTLTPTRPPDNFVNWFAYGTVALGVLIALAILAAYLRYSSRFFGEREERGPRIGTPAPPVVTVGEAARSQPEALAASLTRPPLPIRQSPVGVGAASAGQASGVVTERAPTPAASPTPVAERPAGPVAEGRPEAPTGPAVETQPQADAPGKVTEAPGEADAEPRESPQEEDEATAEAATPDARPEADAAGTEPERPAAEAEEAAAGTASAEQQPGSAEAEPAHAQTQSQAAEPEPAAAPAKPPGGADLDQETYDRVLQEQLGKGMDRRVAEGKARSAAVKAARAKSEG